ncbi:MAG: sugar ABC transporter permease [Lachnospiraceae bacterium]|nr:sugar ABC transporter permease [Lachnospiraceae bacterium]
MMKRKSAVSRELAATHRSQTLRLIKRNWLLYVFLIPAVVYIILFEYAPLYGLQIAFKNYSFAKGFSGSKWVGLKWFETFFNTPRFWDILKNTLRVSVYSMIVSFPFPIILALCMNNVTRTKWKRFAQTVTYMPHFISTVVLVGMMSVMFAPKSGVINTVLSWLGGSGSTYFMGKAEYFPHMYVWSGVWQGMGWGSIIYMAALAGVDPSLHEAAMIDGANKFQRVLHVDLPTIMPTVAIMLIMNCGKLLNVGYEKVYLMQNDLNMTYAEVISTYVYKMGLGNQRYSYSTAIGLFNNVVSFIFLIIVNKIVKKLSGSGLW